MYLCIRVDDGVLPHTTRWLLVLVLLIMWLVWVFARDASLLNGLKRSLFNKAFFYKTTLKRSMFNLGQVSYYILKFRKCETRLMEHEMAKVSPSPIPGI